LQNLPKPTDGKIFETVTTLAVTQSKNWLTLLFHYPARISSTTLHPTMSVES